MINYGIGGGRLKQSEKNISLDLAAPPHSGIIDISLSITIGLIYGERPDNVEVKNREHRYETSGRSSEINA
jgi:hypothetical protein